MGYEDWRHHDSDDPHAMNTFLETLIKLEALEGEVLAVAKQCIDVGYDGLTPKQQHVFDCDIIDAYTRKSCEGCGAAIPWSEMYEAYDNSGFCSYCIHMLNNHD